jgi:hypothetical protein
MRNDTVYPFDDIDDIYYTRWDKTSDMADLVRYSSEYESSTVVSTLPSGYSYLGCWLANRTPGIVMAKGVSEHAIVLASTESSTPRIQDSYAEELRLARAGKRNARTALGRRLWEIRERAIAAGEPLVNLEDIERELDR